MSGANHLADRIVAAAERSATKQPRLSMEVLRLIVAELLLASPYAQRIADRRGLSLPRLRAWVHDRGERDLRALLIELAAAPALHGDRQRSPSQSAKLWLEALGADSEVAS